MKKSLSILLVIATLASLLSGCGGKAEEPAAQAASETEGVMETAAEPTAEPTTEPTLSAEEVLYASLSDRMKQAVDVGIVEISHLEDLSRTVTVGEASRMLQKAFLHRTGVESKVLNELMNTPDYADRTADRGWVLTVPGQTDMELSAGSNYENYKQWQNYLNEADPANWWWGTEDLWYGFNDRLGTGTFSFFEDGVVGRVYYPYPATAEDEAEYFAMMGEDSLYGPDPVRIDPYISVYSYAFEVYDSTTGKKYFQLEEGCINPTKALTVADAAEYALKFYHYPNPMEYPEFVAEEDVGAYNPDIITADLLAKETDLPAASCNALPANWHGVVMKDMGYWERTTHLDDRIYEYEIKAAKEAGFNFVGLELDFSWLQEAVLQNTEFAPYNGFVRDEDVGKFSLSRLEQLDQVIAWCMEYDLHVNLRCVAPGGWSGFNVSFDDVSKTSMGPKLAQWWQAIARRYADIPNEYLSFTLFTSTAGAANPTAAVLMPSVEAIRQVSPDRCIIADIFGWSMKKADAAVFAEAGVALSSRIGTNEKIKALYHRDFYQGNSVPSIKQSGAYMIQNFEWPYQSTDVESLLASKEKDRVYETMAVVEEYGVGFMVSDFGIIVDPYETFRNNYFYLTYRYPDESYQAMITDITSAIAEKGYGWCFANWFGYFGITNSGPMYDNATYEQVEDYPYYIDTAMYGWFREINGVQ